MTPTTSNLLNISRWLAAFFVVIFHVRTLLMVDWRSASEKNVIYKGVYFFCGLGHEAVVVFFVISGFLVGGVTLDRWANKGPDLASYISARVSRIYVVLFPAILLTLLLDVIGLHYLNDSGVYTQSAHYNIGSLPDNVAAQITATNFFGCLLMLQETATGVFGSNGPLWSLAYEWWYYTLFILVAVAYYFSGAKRLIALCAAGVLAFLLQSKLLLWGVIWGLGLVAYFWQRKHWPRPHWALGLSVFLVVLMLSRLSHNVDNITHHEPLYYEFGRDLCLGLAYALFLVAITGLKMKIPFAVLHHRLAEFSYSTYLAHFPIMLFFVAGSQTLLGISFQRQPNMGTLVYFAVIVMAIYLVCYVFSLLSERYTGAARRKLNDWFASSFAKGKKTKMDGSSAAVSLARTKLDGDPTRYPPRGLSG